MHGVGSRKSYLASGVKQADLGQKVDQFFSNRITHLVVKGVASPQKPKAAALSRNSVPESPMNPFLDHIGPTNLTAKAEAMGKKVWTVKSRLMLSNAGVKSYVFRID